jgi:hypothetical protein
MATIDSKDIIDRLIECDGYYDGDERVYAIVEYTNAYGNITYGVTWPRENGRKTRYMIDQPPYVNNPKVIWCQDKSLITG